MTEHTRDTLGEALPAEMARVRELLIEYEKIPVGIFGAAMLRAALDRATRALAGGDVVEMIRCYEDLKGCK